jgi:beta-phosphoglucomutase family hydrolase
MNTGATLIVSRREFDAAIFDLDGVLTDTARLHAAAWETVFNDLLQRRASRGGEPFRPFAVESDYLAYVDGRPREDGIRTFLASRNITLPEGSESDSEDADTVLALGQRKASLFLRHLQRGISPAPGVVTLLGRLRQEAIAIAVATSSRNGAAILKAAALDRLIDLHVDGVVALQLGLPGKPDPAIFLEAARRLGVAPSRAILFEDALAGVAAGRRGNFRCVVGIDRHGQAEALRRHGADIVIESLQQVEVSQD